MPTLRSNSDNDLDSHLRVAVMASSLKRQAVQFSSTDEKGRLHTWQGSSFVAGRSAGVPILLNS